MSNILTRERYFYFLLFLYSFAIVIFALRGYIFSKGLAFFGEFGVNVGWKKYGLYLWDSTKNQGLFVPSFLILDQTLIYLLPLELGQRLSIILTLALVSVSTSIVVFKLNRELGFNGLEAFISAIFASTLAIYNPYVFEKIPHAKGLYFIIGYVISIYVLFKVMNRLHVLHCEGMLKYSIIAGFALSLIMFSIRIAFVIVPLIAFMVVWLDRIVKNFKSFFVFTLMSTSMFLLLTAFFYLPFIPYILLKNSAVQPSYILTDADLNLLSRHAQLANVLLLNAHWHTVAREIITFKNELLDSLRLLLSAMLFILSVSTLLSPIRKNRIVPSLVLVLVLTIFLSKGVNEPFKEFYLWLIFKSPLSTIGWEYRVPENWSIYILLPTLTVLSSFTVAYIVKALRHIKMYITKIASLGLVLTVLLIIPLVLGHPFVSGDLYGKLKPIEMSNNDYILIEWLKSKTHVRRVLWYPNLPLWGSPNPVVKYNSLYYEFIKREFETSDPDIVELLRSIGVKYVVINSSQNKNVMNMLMNLTKNKLVFHIGEMYVFTVNESYDVYVPYRVVLLQDLRDLKAILLKSHEIPIGAVFTSHIFHGRICMSCPILFVNIGFLDYLLICLNNEGSTNHIIVEPYRYTYHGIPQTFWSKASTLDPIGGRWHPYLKKLGIKDWQFDYGHGLVFTWARFYVPSNLHLSDEDLNKYWSFDNQNDCSLWREYTTSKQFNAIQRVSCHNGVLEVKLYNSTWGWKTIKSPLIPVDSTHAYRFVIRIRGINAHKVHIKIVEFDPKRKLVNAKYIQGVGDGTFDWREVVFDYVPSSRKIRYVQLQIWHGHLTNKPLPNIIEIDYVKVYDVTKYAKRITLDMPFNVPRTGRYKIFVRYFENQRGGAIRIYLDDELIAQVNTTSQLNRFVWRDLGTYELSAGKHILTLENVWGFNAINVFLIIPVDEYAKLVDELDKLLKNKTVIYIFEAESDMFRVNAKIVKDINASNGELLLMKPDGYAWQRFEVVKEDYYTVAIRINGSAMVKIDSKTFTISSNSLDFKYIGPIYLKRGLHTILIKPITRPLYLDVVWIYSINSSNSNKTVEDLFRVGETPAKVISYRRINPTLWKAEVIAKKPFMLVFAEAYDPLWEARVYKDGRLVERVRSISVYGVINGFWINETGNLTIVIRYVPQDWFELGLKISATTFALCIFYLVWDWRRSKGDRWALWLERHVRFIPRYLKGVAMRSLS